jgi:TM2 domain-containing membrane protein YozV
MIARQPIYRLKGTHMSQDFPTFCSQCGAHNRPDGTFCRNCGAQLRRTLDYQQQRPPAQFVQPPSPGPAPPQQFAPPPSPSAPQVIIQQNLYGAPYPQMIARPPRSRVSFILLGLFFGVLGVHNFYAGYGGRGAAQLLITLFIGWLIVPIFFVWVWMIIEIIVVKTDAFGIPMT